MPVFWNLLYGTGVAAVGIGAYVFTRPKPAPFHVDNVPPLTMKVGGFNAFPILQFVMRNLPDAKRKSFVAKRGAPKPDEMPKDRYHCLGESPYTVTEVVPERMWKIKYEFAVNMSTSGIDPDSPEYVARIIAAAQHYGKEAVEVAHEDIHRAKELFAKESVTDKELMEAASSSLNSFIVKLNSGGLLLYAPVRIREETGFAEWVNSLGEVEWIVIASGTHTLNLQPVIARYPEAKIIGPPQAQAKLNVISALPGGKVDFDSTNPDDLSAANAMLVPDGVRLYDVAGDVATNALVAVFEEKQLMSCDLLYTHADGVGFLHMSKEQFEELLSEHWWLRFFRYNTTSKPNSPAGFLPSYRYQMMDSNSLGTMLYDQPAWDGSSCTTMANSLREVIKAPFEFANGVHFEQQDREAYIDGLDKSWNWLDGKPLV